MRRLRASLAGLTGLFLVVGLACGWSVRERVGRDFLGTGGDSKYYFDGAAELSSTGALSAGRYCRPPGYSLLIAAYGFAARIPPDWAPRFMSPFKRFQYALDLCTCLLLFFLARRLGGAAAGWLAFAALLLHPLPLPYTSSILSETPATLLVTAALLLLAMDRLLWAAVAIGVASMVRLDALLLLPSLVIAAGPLWRAARPRQVRLIAALAVVALLPAAWMARNWARTGAPRLGAPLCDNAGNPINRGAYLRWLRTWVVDEREYPRTIWRALSPWAQSDSSTYPPSAFDNVAERAEVTRLFALNRRDYFGPEVDEGFRRLAQARERRHPLRTFVALPLIRAYHLSASPVHFIKGKLPGPELLDGLRPRFGEIVAVESLLAAAGLGVLVWRGRRRLAALLGAAWAVRVFGFAAVGLVEGRYLLELLPLQLALAATALTFFLKPPAPPPASPTRP